MILGKNFLKNLVFERFGTEFLAKNWVFAYFWELSFCKSGTEFFGFAQKKPDLNPQVSGDNSSKQKILQAYGQCSGVLPHGDYPKSDVSTSEWSPDGQEGHWQVPVEQAHLASPEFNFSAQVI